MTNPNAELLANAPGLLKLLEAADAHNKDLLAENARLREQIAALPANRKEAIAVMESTLADNKAMREQIAKSAVTEARLRELIQEAYDMAEQDRKASGDARPAALCHVLRAALAVERGEV